MKNIEFKALVHDIEVKEAGQDGQPLRIRGYACAFGNIDSWKDIIEPNALDNFLASDEADRMKLCYQHDRTKVIGVITDKGVDAYGMWFEAEVIDTTLGLDCIKLIKAGALNEFSIGYWVNDSTEEVKDGQYIRHLTDIGIREISLVSHAANPKAILLDAKSDTFQESFKAMSNEEFQAFKTDVMSALQKEEARRVLALL